MEQFKSRFYIKSEKRMVYDRQIIRHGQCVSLVDTKDEYWVHQLYKEVYMADDVIEMPCVGVLDIKYKDIYLKDLVRTEKGLDEVIYRDGMFLTKDSKSPIYGTYEVVGNSFEGMEREQ